MYCTPIADNLWLITGECVEGMFGMWRDPDSLFLLGDDGGVCPLPKGTTPDAVLAQIERTGCTDTVQLAAMLALTFGE